MSDKITIGNLENEFKNFSSKLIAYNKINPKVSYQLYFHIDDDFEDPESNETNLMSVNGNTMYLLCSLGTAIHSVIQFGGLSKDQIIDKLFEILKDSD